MRVAVVMVVAMAAESGGVNGGGGGGGDGGGGDGDVGGDGDDGGLLRRLSPARCTRRPRHVPVSEALHSPSRSPRATKSDAGERKRCWRA